MPYGDLVAQRVQRYATYDDLDRHETTIEEREEYEPHLDAGRVLYAGVDYEAILREAEQEADVILWDGGNNDFPFYRPDLFIVVADPLRPGDELHYHPGETNVRMADVVVINKIDSAEPAVVDAVRGTIRELNPTADVLTARSELTLIGPSRASASSSSRTARRSPTAACRMGPGSSPRGASGPASWSIPGRQPSARSGRSWSAIRRSSRSSRRWATAAQIGELEATLNAIDADLVLSATPIDLTRVLTLNKPITRVRYELAQEVRHAARRGHRADRPAGEDRHRRPESEAMTEPLGEATPAFAGPDTSSPSTGSARRACARCST